MHLSHALHRKIRRHFHLSFVRHERSVLCFLSSAKKTNSLPCQRRSLARRLGGRAASRAERQRGAEGGSIRGSSLKVPPAERGGGVKGAPPCTGVSGESGRRGGDGAADSGLAVTSPTETGGSGDERLKPGPLFPPGFSFFLFFFPFSTIMEGTD